MRFFKDTGDILIVVQRIWSGKAMKTDELLMHCNSWKKSVIKIEKTCNNHSNNDLPVPYETNKYVPANIVNFIMRYFDDAHQNKKSTNAFSEKQSKTPACTHTHKHTDKKPNRKREGNFVLFFINHMWKWWNFPKLFRSFCVLLLSVTDADRTLRRGQTLGFQHWKHGDLSWSHKHFWILTVLAVAICQWYPKYSFCSDIF